MPTASYSTQASRLNIGLACARHEVISACAKGGQWQHAMSLYSALLGYRDLPKLHVESFWLETWRFKHIQTPLFRTVLYCKNMLWEHFISVIATALDPWLAEVCIPALSLVAPLSAPVKEAGDGRRLCICSKNFLPMRYPGILAILVFMCYMVLREGCTVVRKLPWNSRSIWKIWINSGAKRGWNLFCSSLQYEEIFHWESQGTWAWALTPRSRPTLSPTILPSAPAKNVGDGKMPSCSWCSWRFAAYLLTWSPSTLPSVACWQPKCVFSAFFIEAEQCQTVP